MQAFWHFMAFFGILLHFGVFAKKSEKKSNLVFPILSDFYPILIRFNPIYHTSSNGHVKFTQSPRKTINEKWKILNRGVVAKTCMSTVKVVPQATWQPGIVKG